MDFFDGVPPPQHPAPRVHSSLLPDRLTHLGALGPFAVAVVDPSVIPLPLPGSTDLLLLWLVAHSGNPWFLATMAISGSLLGADTPPGMSGAEGAKRLSSDMFPLAF